MHSINIILFSSLDKLASPNKYKCTSSMVDEGTLIRYVFVLSDGLDIQKKKCLVVSDLPQEHKGKSVRFLRYR